MNLKIFYALGTPFSLPYAGMMALRACLYEKNFLASHRFHVPVISVGNVTMGGTGKTPMVIYLAELLQKNGLHPAVLSRGYGGSAKEKINVVSDGRNVRLTPAAAGDEPVMMAKQLHGVPVLTGAERTVTGNYAIRTFAADCLLLDDGFQHMQVKRDLDLVLFNAGSFSINSRVFPGGELREPLAALKRASAFIITNRSAVNNSKADELEAMLRQKFNPIPVFSGRYAVSAIEDANACKIERAALDKMKCAAFCGIAKPESFLGLLEEEGFAVQNFLPFPDHHVFSQKDIDVIEAAARRCGAGTLLATAKDQVKLRSLRISLPIYYIKVAMHMSGQFDSFILRNFRSQSTVDSGD